MSRRFLSFFKNLPTQRERVKRLYGKGHISAATKTLPLQRQSRSALGLSTLDIIACGLGAVTFIAILNMLIKVPIPPPLSEDFILAEVRSEKAGVFGFAVRHNRGDWFYVRESKIRRTLGEKTKATPQDLLVEDYVYSVGVESCSEPYALEGCQHTIAHLLLHKPAIGDWDIEPFFRAFRKEGGVSKGQGLSAVKCFYWTRTAEFHDSGENCVNDMLSAPAKRPGIFSTEIEK